LNFKKQHQPETLNLIMFCHNHCKYKAGKGNGKTELLTGTKQEKDRLEILLEKVGDHLVAA